MTWNEFKAEIDRQLKLEGERLSNVDVANGDVEVSYIDTSLSYDEPVASAWISHIPGSKPSISIE